MRQTSSNMQRATTTCNATDNMHRETGNVRHATETLVGVDNAGKTTDGVHRVTNMQQGKRQQGNMRPAANNGQRAAFKGQQTTDNRRHARGREHMRDATGNTRHCRFSCAEGSEQRVADNQQHARRIVLDNQCATRHRRHTRCNTRPYDPCHSMQQTQTEPTTRSRQCNVRDEANEIRTLAHLGARCGGGGGVGWSVGLGLPESDVTAESCNSQNWAFGRRNPTPRNPMSQTRNTKEGCTERPKRQEVAEAKERASALRSRREQLVNGAAFALSEL
jgi:hypothetical protein